MIQHTTAARLAPTPWTPAARQPSAAPENPSSDGIDWDFTGARYQIPQPTTQKPVVEHEALPPYIPEQILPDPERGAIREPFCQDGFFLAHLQGLK